jgi:hypothetical protein
MVACRSTILNSDMKRIWMEHEDSRCSGTIRAHQIDMLQVMEICFSGRAKISNLAPPPEVEPPRRVAPPEFWLEGIRQSCRIASWPS